MCADEHIVSEQPNPARVVLQEFRQGNWQKRQGAHGERVALRDSTARAIAAADASRERVLRDQVLLVTCVCTQNSWGQPRASQDLVEKLPVDLVEAFI